MPRPSRARLGWLLLASVAGACAVYDAPGTPPSSGTGGTGGSGGGVGDPEGGSGGKPSGGSNVGSLGDGEGGMAAGGSGFAGEPSMAGAPTSDAGAGGAFAGDGGAGGEGGAPPTCTTVAPDATCTCVAHDAHDYWFCTTFLGFTAAEAKCTARGMHLPKVETQAEDAWLFAMCAEKSMGEYFLGGSDADVPDTWTWLQGGTFWQGVADGTAMGYTNWNSNEPNDSGDCLVVQSNGPWDDRTCGDQRKYVCEAPL